MSHQAASMTSLRLSLRACAVTLSTAGLLVLSACPAGDDTAESGDTLTGTSTPMMTDSGMDSGSTAGTDPDSGSGSPADVSHAEDIQPIWDEHCVTGCHEPGGEWGMFLDMSGDAYDKIVGVPAPQLMSMNHVEPGDLDTSYLWHKINGTQVAAGGSGLDMPKARLGEEVTVLTEDQLQLIRDWIAGGAAE